MKNKIYKKTFLKAPKEPIFGGDMLITDKIFEINNNDLENIRCLIKRSKMFINALKKIINLVSN